MPYPNVPNVLDPLWPYPVHVPVPSTYPLNIILGGVKHSFSEREAEEQAERERLQKQWQREQEQIRNEPLEITYSYWDGAGHRRVLQVRKGDTIGEFLRAVQQQLAPEFREIRTTSVENLLYVKEDLIIPHVR
ncbi:hypothetical protein CsSME_00025552 [Camellia sinensis var. sinensis]